MSDLDPTREIKQVLAPDYRKMFTFAVAVLVTIGAILMFTLWSVGVASTFVEAHAKAVWAETMMKSQTQQQLHETTLQDHAQRLAKLEQQGQETSGRLIKMDGKLDQVISAVQDLKDSKRK